MLDNFIEYLELRNNKSLIAKIYGVFTIKSNVFKSVDVMIMENTSFKKNPKSQSVKFDLKGSLYKRETRIPSYEAVAEKGCKSILKDINLLRLKKEMDKNLLLFN
jgi:hypothetical protein